jgi:hypothetical protein
MNNEEEIGPEMMRRMDEEFQSLRLRLNRLPRRPAPADLMRKLKSEYMGPSWLDRIRAWLAWPVIWKPVGVLALAALLAGAWIAHWKNSEDEFIDDQPLIAAHARYEQEALVPQGDMAHSEFGAHLAVYYGDEN